jgi:hypothetical protein
VDRDDGLRGARRCRLRAPPARSWIAALVFLGAAASLHGHVWLAGADAHVATVARARRWAPVLRSDHEFVVWQTSRNARALREDLAGFFDAGHCFPARRTLALGEPMLTLGLLALPAEALGAGPIRVYNLVLLGAALLAAAAAFALVRSWTGCVPAALVAGLLYAFHAARTRDPVHPYVYDTTWAVLAILFAERLLARARWRDAVALAAAAVLEIGTSFYALVASLVFGQPLAIWLVARYGLRRVRWSQLALVGALVGIAAAWLFAPYLELRRAGALAERTQQVFTAWSEFLPGARLFPGWTALALVAAGLALPARRALPAGGDPRLALAAGTLLVAFTGAGPGWRLLTAVAPGFDAVRVPGTVSSAVQLGVALLAGIGAAGLLARLCGRPWSRAAAAGLVALTAVETLEPRWLGLPRQPDYEMLKIAPEPAALAFFEGLARRGNDGPIFELPLPRIKGGVYWPATATWILESAYHGRPTSACISSHTPDLRHIEALEERLPERAALRELEALGFTTIVFRHRLGSRAEELGGLRRKPVQAVLGGKLVAFAGEAAAADGWLTLVLQDEDRAAYAIGPRPPPPRGGP